MSKRPSIGLNAVVRKSRLAAKGEAAPARDHHHGSMDQPEQPVVVTPAAELPVSVIAEVVVPVATPVATVAEAPPSPAVENLLAALAGRDEQLALVRADLARVVQERDLERAGAAEALAQQAATLAATTAALDGLRERLGDSSPEQLRADLARVVQERDLERAGAAEALAQQTATLAATTAALDGLRERLGDSSPEQLRADLARVVQERDQERAGSAEALAQQAATLAATTAALDGLRERLGDSSPEQLRADLARVVQERDQERAAAERAHDQLVGNLSAADATIDELRNRVGDLRSQLELARTEVSRLIEQHAAERQRLLEHHRGESERLLQATATGKFAVPAPSAPGPHGGAPAQTGVGEDGVLRKAWRWLFGDGVEAKPKDQGSQKPPVKSAPVSPRPAVGTPPPRPTVAKPVGPPTAPKVLNRRPIS